MVFMKTLVLYDIWILLFEWVMVTHWYILLSQLLISTSIFAFDILEFYDSYIYDMVTEVNNLQIQARQQTGDAVKSLLNPNLHPKTKIRKLNRIINAYIRVFDKIKFVWDKYDFSKNHTKYVTITSTLHDMRTIKNCMNGTVEEQLARHEKVYDEVKNMKLLVQEEQYLKDYDVYDLSLFERF
uniref:Uncharacterized protein n=1 Tax=Clastoptera arizonana TaxID=38151 RepID=A0A1B6DMV0_9HEMI